MLYYTISVFKFIPLKLYIFVWCTLNFMWINIKIENVQQDSPFHLTLHIYSADNHGI